MRYPVVPSEKEGILGFAFSLSRRDTLVQIDDISYFSLLDLLFILRDKRSGNVIYRPNPHILLKSLSGNNFLVGHSESI